MERIILHIDVNNAFLSWTAIDLLQKGSKYDIRNSYAVIGGDESRRSGIVLAKSMPCKKLGIHTAETIYSAKKKCPAIRVYPPNFSFYSQMSQKLFALLTFYTPDIEVASIDECYMDYGKVKLLYGDEVMFAHQLKNRIYQELGFTVNIGIANNKLCAKMASDFSKPNRVHTLYDSEVATKMHPLPIEELFGIGKKTAPKLRKLGIETIGDLAHFDEKTLAKFFKNMAHSMIESAQGISNAPVISDRVDPKGIGNEITLSKDMDDAQELLEILLDITENVAARLRREKKYAHTICVTIKTKDFKRRSHQKKLLNATNVTKEIYEAVKMVFLEMFDGEPIRLIGVRLDNLVDYCAYQGTLFESLEPKKESALDQVIDDIKLKYGSKVIKKASLTDEKHFKN